MAGGVKSWIEKLSSECADERLCACKTIAGLSDEFSSAPKLLLNDVVCALTPLLKDSRLAVKVCALGALRNLCMDVGDAVRQMLVIEPTIMTSIIRMLSMNLPVENDDDVSVNNNCVQLQSICLLIDLCANCEEAVNFFKQYECAMNLLMFITDFHEDLQLQLAAAELLQIVSEKNYDFAKILSTSENMSSLAKVLLTPHSTYLQYYIKIVTCNIIYNVLQVSHSSCDTQLMSSLVHLLCSAFELDAYSAVKELAANFSNIMDYGFKSKAEEVKYLLKSQQAVFENTANIFATDDSDDDWEDAEDSSDETSSEIVKFTNTNELPNDSAMECGKSDSTFSKALQLALEFQGITAKVFSCLNSKEVEAFDILNQCLCDESLIICMTRRLQAMLGCVNNLLLSFELGKLGGAEACHNLFNWLLCLAKKFQEDNLMLIEITGALHSTIQTLSSVNCPKLLDVCRTDLLAVFELSKYSSDDCTVQVNLLRTISSLGQFVAKLNPATPELLRIAEFLFFTASETKLLWVSAEALDAIFDVFAEDDTDPVLHEFQMVEKLQTLQPTFMQKYRMQKKSCTGDQRAVVSTVLSNFSHFILSKSSCIAARNS